MAEVTKGFKGDVGVVPRQFLRELITQMDLVDENPDYDPSAQYGFSPSELSDEERSRLSGMRPEIPEADDDLVPNEDTW